MSLQDALALSVGGSFERVVVVGAVGLDDKPLLWPAQVRHDAPAVEEQRLIHEGMDEAGAQDQVEHRVLQFALGRCRAGGEDPGEPLMRSCCGALSPLTSTSGYLSSHAMMFWRAADDHRHSAAPDPHALTAARNHPSRDGFAGPC
jgi:hypothetical protein